MKRQITLVLHDIRSKENVGSIFRTAEAAGVSKIFLTGYSPAPLDRFQRVDKAVAKASLGAEKTVPWERKANHRKLLETLKENGFKIIAVEQAPNSRDYKKVKADGNVVFILGNETEGLPQSVLALADEIAEIPMRGKLARNRLPNDGGKESLNVSVATGIVLFRILDI
jgi:tRNA G18 (ribose-2'-O)-methylase SpoU